METSLKSVFITAALSLFVGCSDQSQQDSDQSDTRALTLVNNFTESFSANWASKNAEAMGNLYAEDAVRIVSARQTPVYGKEAITAQFEGDFDGAFETTKIEAVPSLAKFLSPDLVLATGTFSVTDAEGKTINQGYWGNAFKLQGSSLTMLMESAGDSAPNGMRRASLETPEMPDQMYEGPGANLVKGGVDAYVLNTNTANLNGIADLFTQNGIQAVSNNERILFGRDNILETLKQNPATEIKLDAWPYGYREIGNSIAIGWGGYRQTDPSGAVVEFGQWGNIWEVTETGLKIVIERASAFSGE
jgi:uncharacterized protein (TIGR02246 family)